MQYPAVILASNLLTDDPHGYVLTLVAVGVVFLCLLSLFLLFSLTGQLALARKRQRTIRFAEGRRRRLLGFFGFRRKGHIARPSRDEAAAIALALSTMREEDATAAAIALGLEAFQRDRVHDEESYVITIRR